MPCKFRVGSTRGLQLVLGKPLGDRGEFTSKSVLEDAQGTRCFMKSDFLKIEGSSIKDRKSVV